MFESPVKQNLSPSPEGARHRRLSIYSVLLVLTRGRDLCRSANVVSAGNQVFPPPLI